MFKLLKHKSLNDKRIVKTIFHPHKGKSECVSLQTFVFVVEFQSIHSLLDSLTRDFCCPPSLLSLITTHESIRSKYNAELNNILQS